ncbi:CHAP domain-containing protein [Muricoccus radiodurans]|uniref:CHAP domain-containing protein n=1 Tax=Muricoccus radiodurans TaxID=2231721 RepID=UPI003CE6BCDD
MSGLHNLVRSKTSRNVVAPVVDAIYGRMFDEWARAQAPWMAEAYSQKGTQEDHRKGMSTERILEYFDSCWYTRFHAPPGVDLTSDDTAWCSAFVNWCLLRVGIRGTGSTWSLSWLKWDGGVHLGTDIARAPLGSLVVLDGGSRGPSKGHVAFLWSMEGGKPQYLGGNQGNGTLHNRKSDQVSICHYPNKVRQCIWPRRTTGPVPRAWQQGRPA